jgi:di/tricarboxylate transporter
LPNLVLVGLFETQLHLRLSYVDWFIMQWPYLGMFVLTQWWVQHYFKTRKVTIAGGFEAVQKQHRELPKTSQSEWLILAVFCLIALAWMTEQWHRVATHNTALIGMALLFMPGVFKFKWKELQDRTIWGTLLLLAGALSLSSAMSTSGLAGWLSDRIHPLAEGHPWWMILLILMVGTHVIRLGMLSNVAAITMLAPILLAMAPETVAASGRLHHADLRHRHVRLYPARRRSLPRSSHIRAVRSPRPTMPASAGSRY